MLKLTKFFMLKSYKSIFLIVLVLFLTSSFAAESVSSCRSFDAIDQGESFELTQDISTGSATCLEINEVDITIDCKGFSVEGGFNGIEINSEDNIELRNCRVIGNQAINAIVDNSYFENNTFISTTESLFDASDNNTFVCNTFIGGSRALTLNDSNNNNFSCLTIQNSSIGLYLEESGNNYFSGNIENTTTTAIHLVENDPSIVDNVFALQLFENTVLTDDFGEFEEYFDSNENDLSQTFRQLRSTFNFNDILNNTLNNVNVLISSTEVSFSLNKTLNSSQKEPIFASYFEYDSAVSDIVEKNISNYSFVVSKTDFSTVQRNTTFNDTYSFTLFSTTGINLSITSIQASMFDNESQVIEFEVVDINNYDIANLSVTLNGALVNVTPTNITSGGAFTINVNGSNFPLGNVELSITATNDVNISNQLNQTFEIVSSTGPQIQIETPQNYTFVNQTLEVNITIISNETFTFNVTTSRNETLSNVSTQLYESNTSGEVVFFVEVADRNGLTNSANKTIQIYVDGPITFNISAKDRVANNVTTTLKVINVTDVNNVSKWYEMYINNSLIANSTSPNIEVNISSHSAHFYTVFDNVTNTTKTYLDVEVRVESEIGTQGSKNYTYEIVNASNVTVSLVTNSPITQGSNLNVVVTYDSSLNYSYDSTEVLDGNTSLQNASTQSFSISGLTQGTYTFDFVVCNEVDECRTITQTVVVNQRTSSSGGGGGGGGGGGSSSSGSAGSGSTSFGFSQVEITQSNSDDVQVISTPFFQEVEEDEEVVFEVEQASLLVDETEVLEGSTGLLTQGLGSLLAIIIGFLIISAIIFFALKRKS